MKKHEKSVKNNKYINKNCSDLIIKTIVFFLISILFVSTLLIKDKIENFVNFSYNEKALSTILDEGGLKIHFIDVGQADATLIELPNDKVILIDCGDNKEDSHSKFISYLETINFLIEDDEPVIDYLILTHPDSDHIGGAEYIFDNFKVKHCYRPDVYSLSEELPEDESLIAQLTEGSAGILYDNVIAKIEEEGCTSIKTVQELELISDNNNFNWALNFYAPISSKLPYLNDGDFKNPRTNDYSPIMIFSYMDRKIMFTGDAGDSVEKSFVEFYSRKEYSYIDFDIDFLKLGHHGSSYSTCIELLDFVTPEYFVASASANNPYGHPSPYTLERLNDYGISSNCIYRTDLNGNIILGVSQEGGMSLVVDNVQYSTFLFQWWMIYLIAEVGLVIVIYSPYLIKIIKKRKKH